MSSCCEAPPSRRGRGGGDRTGRIVRGAALVLALALGAFLLGPRVQVDTEVVLPALPDGDLVELAAALREAEGAVPGITPGAEKEIVFAEPHRAARTELSLVYLHGFSATRREIEPVTERVARALGANRFMARLTGHGRDGTAMGEATVNAWLTDGEEAMAIGSRIGERVVLVGTSTGGTLALWLAANSRLRDRIAAVVLVSPNLGVPNPMAGLLLWPWGETLASWVVGPEYSFEPRNEDQARWWTWRYPSRALLPMQALVQEVRDTDLGELTLPTLVFYSPDDEVVDPERTREAFQQLGSPGKRLVSMPGEVGMDAHVLAGDILSPGNTDRVVEEVVTFLQQLDLREDAAPGR